MAADSTESDGADIPYRERSLIGIAVHAISWNVPRGDDVAAWLTDAADAGYDGVAVFASQLLDFRADPAPLKAMLAEHRLTLVAVTTSVADPWDDLLDMMAAFDVPYLVLTDNRAQLDLEGLAAALNQLGSIAATRGILARYHNRTGAIAATAESLEELQQQLEPGAVGLMLDVGHAAKDFTQGERAERARAFLERHLPPIDYVELKDFNDATDLNTPLGEGDAGIADVLALLDARDYRGWLTVEQNGNLGASRGRSSHACARISRAFLRDHGFHGRSGMDCR
jgi:sugar phosphate isomerase/epimerase